MLILVKNSHGYFSEVLQNALKKSNVSLSDSAQVYIIHMLDDFSRSEKIFSGVEYGEKIYFFDLLNRALVSQDQEALRIFRHMGDVSLYLCGFFEEFTQNKLISVSYYIDMGISAYAQASEISRAYTASNSATFLELSDQFCNIAKVLKKITNNNI